MSVRSNCAGNSGCANSGRSGPTRTTQTLSRLGILLAVVGQLLLISPATADGTETLGPPSIAIADGTGLLAAGTGLVTQPGSIDIDIAADLSIKQVLVYWEGVGTGSTRNPATANPVTDNSIRIDGTEVVGALIGGPTILNPAIPNFTTNYRADITGLGLVGVGSNSLQVDGLEYDWSNSGAGIVVVVDDGSGAATVQILDGNDFAFINSPPTRDTTVPQTFVFDSAPVDRVIPVNLFFSNVRGANSGGDQRPTVIESTVAGVVTQHVNMLSSADGEEWDTLRLDIAVPAGATSITLQALSADVSNSGLIPASFSWTFAGLVVQPYVNRDGMIGDLVWKDLNQDGIRDAGEPGVGGFTVRLYDDVGTLLAEDVTEPDGSYLFDNLDISVVYQVEFVNDPAMNMPFTVRGVGDMPTVDSDAGPDGRSNLITLTAADPTDFTIDAGIVTPLAGLGDLVWKDLNSNGQQDIGEPGVDGIGINLLDSAGAPTGLSTTTSGGGFYQFENLQPGGYIVEFLNDPAMGMPFTTPGLGDAALDSNADVASGRTAVIDLASGEFNSTIDAGLVNSKTELPVCKIIRYGHSKGYLYLKFADRDSILDYIRGDTVIGAPAIYTTAYRYSRSAGPGADADLRDGFRYNDNLRTAYASPRQRFFAVWDRHSHKKWYYMKTWIKNVSWLYIGDEDHKKKCKVIRYSPIALDLNGDGQIEQTDTGVEFDFAGDGNRVATAAWFGAGDGVLFDASVAVGANGEVTGAHLFGNEGGRFVDGFAKLGLRDRNGDGELRGAELQGLALWLDNGDARVGSAELRSLEDYGLVALPVTHTNMRAAAERANGTTVLMEDIWFAPAAAAALVPDRQPAGVVAPYGIGLMLLLLASMGHLWQTTRLRRNGRLRPQAA